MNFEDLVKNGGRHPSDDVETIQTLRFGEQCFEPIARLRDAWATSGCRICPALAAWHAIEIMQERIHNMTHNSLILGQAHLQT